MNWYSGFYSKIYGFGFILKLNYHHIFHWEEGIFSIYLNALSFLSDHIITLQMKGKFQKSFRIIHISSQNREASILRSASELLDDMNLTNSIKKLQSMRGKNSFPLLSRVLKIQIDWCLCDIRLLDLLHYLCEEPFSNDIWMNSEYQSKLAICEINGDISLIFWIILSSTWIWIYELLWISINKSIQSEGRIC